MAGVSVRFLQFLAMSLLAPGTAGLGRGGGNAAAVQDQAGGVRLLQPGETVHSKLRAPEDRFEIRVESGVFLRILVLAEAPVRVLLSDPDGRELVSGSVAPDFEVPVSTVTRGAGSYALRIQAAEAHVAGTTCRLSVNEVRPARPDDQTRSGADQLVLKSSAFSLGTQSEALEAVYRNLETARRSYQDLNDREDAAGVLILSGRLHFRADNFDRAAEILETALTLSRETGNLTLEVSALNAISVVYAWQGKGPEAVAAGQTGLRMARDARDRWLEARALAGLGDALYTVGQLNEALESYFQAAALWRDLGWRRGEAEALLNLGYTYADLEKETNALDAFTRAEALWQALGDKTNRAETLRALGGLYSKLDDEQKALDYYFQAEELLPPAGERKQRALLSNAIGLIYFDLGEMQVAASYFRQALEAARSIGYRQAVGVYLYELGRVSFEMKEYARAREYYQASLTTYREIGNQRSEGEVMLELGLVHLAEGRNEEALDLLNSALGSVRQHASPYIVAKCLEAIGRAHHVLGNHDRAFQFYSEALGLIPAGSYRYREAQVRLLLARLEKDRGNFESARRQSETAIEVIESVRMDMPGPEFRASYFSSTHDYFEFHTDLLMRLHGEKPTESFDARAFEVAERGRARSLLDSLAEARVEVREGVDAALLERESDLKRRLNRAAERQAQLPGEDKAGLDTAGKEIQNLTAEYEQVRALIRTRSPKYAALTQPHPLTLGEVQQKLLDEDTILLEYALGEENSYLWAVSADSYETHRLPGRKPIEDSVLELRNLLTAYETRPGETTRDRRVRIREAGTRYWEKAAALSGMLLGPVAAKIANKRLLIVSDGALEYLPFAALAAPNPPPGDDPTPLVLEHELILLPSASTLAVLRDQMSGRKKAEKWLAVLADPVFESQDPRLRQPRARPSRGPAGGIRYPRLPSTRIEAEAIAALAPAGEAMTAVGLKANRQLATSPELGQYRIVHFATHGILHYEHPELSGVALSMFDEQGQPQEGLLRLHDIYNLRLPVELVVLSACESYLGKQVRGEGLMGVVRGFMYAGASRVIASLWKVDDLATKELMVRFYRNVFAKGESPAAALRDAQIEMWRQPDWRSPYYWAAFVLQGEWR